MIRKNTPIPFIIAIDPAKFKQVSAVCQCKKKVYTDVSSAALNYKTATQLNLQDKKFFVMDDSLAMLENLTFLNLIGNNFEAWQPSVFSLKKLEVLNVYDNHLSTIPNEFSNLLGLKKLDISKNKLSSLPAT